MIADICVTMSVLTLPDAAARSLTVRAKALVFHDPRSQALLQRIRQLAPSDATVLIAGETGTGKEIVARHVHDLSARARRPFVAVNCGALSDTLVESELFGHERGAFTGATAAKPGWFEAAHGGTLFLDEIGDLPPAVQVKLLRVLQEREVVRLGSRQPLAIDVRLVAATNVDLHQAVRAGRFREDLYYRLKVAVLELPPLRERPGDIAPLARYFLERYRQRLNMGPGDLHPGAVQRLLEHAWPGNIRELENVIHSALLVCQGPDIQPGDLQLGPRLVPANAPAAPAATLRSAAAAAGASAPAAGALAALEQAMVALYDQDLPDLHAQIEATLMRSAFAFCHRNQLQTARLLGTSRNIVRARLQQLGEITASPRRRPLAAAAGE
jgi:sigma-54-specific transcriptional regulator